MSQSAFDSLVQRDLTHIWHPCAQMKDFETYPPLIVRQARGSYIETDQGLLIDAISSWWCKSLGHNHPKLIAAIQQQLSQFEHVIAANTTHPALVAFGEKLAKLTHKQYIFFANDGSSAVEIALKMCLHAQQIKGQAQRKTFLSLKNAYHGETLGALSVSDLGIYKKAYEGYGVPCSFIEPLPYLHSIQDPLWKDAHTYWEKILPSLEASKDKFCALIIEPLVQGAAGMRCYSADFLKRLVNWAQANGIYVIADEIMTGIGRTGTWLASTQADIEADLVCLSKGLTAGTLPLSTVSIDKKIFDLFYTDKLEHAFLHSHTYSGHALALSAALATIEVIEEEAILSRVSHLEKTMRNYFEDFAKITGKLHNIRSFGAIVAADLSELEHHGGSLRLYQEAVKQGALIRPIANTLYWLPPLNIDNKTLSDLAQMTLTALKTTYAI